MPGTFLHCEVAQVHINSRFSFILTSFDKANQEELPAHMLTSSASSSQADMATTTPFRILDLLFEMRNRIHAFAPSSPCDRAPQHRPAGHRGRWQAASSSTVPLPHDAIPLPRPCP
jgi:hypothetical protein